MHDLDFCWRLVVGQGEVAVGALGKLHSRLVESISGERNQLRVLKNTRRLQSESVKQLRVKSSHTIVRLVNHGDMICDQSEITYLHGLVDKSSSVCCDKH